MKVILETDIVGLGEEGDIVNVSSGYARNYLFPEKKAKQNNSQNISILESRRHAIAKRREERRKEQLDLSQRLQAEKIVLTMNAGENGHLFGAVTSNLIAEELEKKGISIPKKNLIMTPIKELGVYTIDAKLYQGVDAQFKVTVQDKDGNIAPLAKAQIKENATKNIEKENSTQEVESKENTEIKESQTNTSEEANSVIENDSNEIQPQI